MQNNGRCRQAQSPQKAVPQQVPELPLPVPSEPAMRRWPHPTAPEAPSPESLPAELYRLECALSQQTRLLSEIRALLEDLTASLPDRRDGAP